MAEQGRGRDCEELSVIRILKPKFLVCVRAYVDL